ncbi:MAG: YaaC family protein [Planctomycetota bacterium]|nr:YaaC family protein [Planctomycetota bacterium]
MWPVERTTRRYGLGARVFATDPWTVIRRSAERRCSAATKDAAFALLEQAEDFFTAASSGVKAAKPLLLYYCYMNLLKAFLLTSRKQNDVNNAQHGLSELLDDAVPNPVELINAFLNAYQSPNAQGRLQNFSELFEQLTGAAVLANPTRYDLTKLMPQIVPGHRLWVEGDSNSNGERFVSIERLDFVQDVAAKEIWIRIYVVADDLKRINTTHQDFLIRTRLQATFRETATAEVVNGRPMVCFEQQNGINYNHRPADKIPHLVATVRHLIWRTILIAPPYRKYYLYSAPVAEHAQVVPQTLSIYAITYYLGSIVRYRPHHFDRILRSNYGPFVESFLNDQASQFIYLMASEFAEREVTKAAIV